MHLVDNYSRGVYAQKCNADVELDTNAGEKIFSLFLNLSNSRITSIVKLKAQAEENSTYVQSSQLDLKCKDRKITY